MLNKHSCIAVFFKKSKKSEMMGFQSQMSSWMGHQPGPGSSSLHNLTPGSWLSFFGSYFLILTGVLIVEVQYQES